MTKGISLPLELPYIDKESSKVVYPWLKGRGEPTKLRQYPLMPEEEVRLLLVRKLILEYGYSPEQIDLEVEIKSGQTTLPKRADIVIFHNGRSKDPESNAYIICEVKKKDRKDGLDQLETYINNTTTEFGIWWNGKDIVHLHRLKEPHRFEEIPDIPRKGETLEDVGTWSKEKLIAATNLISVFDTIHNHVYANEGLLKEKVFNEMLKFIFMKMVDEKLAEPKPYFRITAKELEAVREGKGESFKERIETIWTRVKKEYGDVFNEDERINLQLASQAFVVSQFQRFDFRRTPADIKGTAFQTFVYAHQRGERGEFFTPHPVAELMVEMIAPSDPEAVLDPACGSGGLLVCAMLHVWEKIDKATHLNQLEKRERKYTYARYYIRGIDFNPDLARVSKMHMVVYEDGHTGCFCANSLEEFEKIKRIAIDFGAIRVTEALREDFEVVFTNPPFGTKGKVTDRRILQQFDLGFKWVKDKKTGKWYRTDKIQDGQTPETLFIERCIQFLKPHGRLAIVLPDGILSTSTAEYVRQFIRERTQVLAVVSMPQETFVPCGAGTKTSVLFLKKSSTISERYPIFMALCNRVGYDIKGRTTYRRGVEGDRILDKSGEPILDTDVPDIITEWQEFLEREKAEDFYEKAEEKLRGKLAIRDLSFQDELTWVLWSDELEGRLDADYYAPKYRKVAALLKLKEGKTTIASFGSLIDSYSTGPAFRSEDYLETGVPLIRIKNIRKNELDLSDTAFLPTTLHLQYPEAIAKTGDLLISMSGTVGNVAIVPEEIGQCSINQRVARVRLKEGVNKDYVCLFLNSILGELQLRRIGTGGLQTNISFNDIKKVKVILPPSEAQQRVADLADLARQRRKERRELMEQAKREVEEYIEKEAAKSQRMS